MSYVIEKEKLVLHLPEDLERPSNNPEYLAIAQRASNNIVPKDFGWEFIAYGKKHQVIQTICKPAGSCEGGGLKPNDKWTTPEEYIVQWREKIKYALPLGKLLETNTLSGSFYIRTELWESAIKIKNFDIDIMKTILKEYFIEEEIIYNEKVFVIKFDIKDRKSVTNFVSFRTCARDRNLLYMSKIEMDTKEDKNGIKR